jgi:membrane peptidoglycan carboxypeptidase
VTAVQPDKKNVMRPDVAFIMNDIMKDVINRGTAAQVQSWGMRNVSGKTAFAGKTGTSRDGWFAGFTPEIVCVVYVGFDDGSDLGMKGSDSAMPIWGDFMKEALRLHSEWNGEWATPANIRRAEIDIRNGALVRELDLIESTVPSPAVANIPEVPEELRVSEPAQIFVTDVPGEFRRVEYFIAGTVPNRSLLPVPDASDIDIPERPEPSPTPLSGTWQDSLDLGDNRAVPDPGRPPPDRNRRVIVMVCPLTKMRATAKCDKKESRTFGSGDEPEEFCTFHR